MALYYPGGCLKNCVQIHRVLSLPAAAAPVLEVEGGRGDDGDEQRDCEDEDGDTDDDQVGTMKQSKQ